MHRVAIGIPSFNDPKLLCENIECLRDTVPFQVPVAIADDCSEEANVKIVKARYPAVHVIANDRWNGSPWVRNQLYAWARDQGKEFACLIDMDDMVQLGWLQALLAVMDRQPWCWLATFPMASFEPRDRWLDEGSEYLRTEEVGWLCALTRLRALSECPGWPSPAHGTFGMDERFRGCAHDSELCQRINRNSNWRVYLAKENLIVHKHGGYHSGRGRRGAFVEESRQESRGVWGNLMAEKNWFGTFPSSTCPPQEPPK